MISYQMRKMIKEVFLGVRFLVSLYFLLISFSASPNLKGAIALLTALYFSFGLLAYVKTEGTKLINKLVDVLFIPPLVLLTQDSRSLFVIVPLVVMHTNRNPLSAGLLLVCGILIAAYMLSKEPLWLFSTLIVLVASPISALIPDFTKVIRKERDSIKELRSSYRKLLGDFARWERDRKELDSMKFLMDAAISSQDVHHFLRKVKERFNVRKVHVIPKREVESYKPLLDRERGVLSVPVKLEEGNAVVIFETESPFQLNDELLVLSLERAGRMVSLFVAGFEDNSSLGRSISIG